MFGFDIYKGLYVHMNEWCNPVLSLDDEREERMMVIPLYQSGL